MSNQETLLETLRNVRFLHDIDDEYLRRLASIADLESFPQGAVLFHEGQDHTKIYFVVSGAVALEVRVSQQDLKRLQTVGSGELLGWSPILGLVEMTATARALQPTQVVALDTNQLKAICEHDPRFGLEFMRRTAQALAKRLSATRLQLLDVYNHEIPVTPASQEA